MPSTDLFEGIAALDKIRSADALARKALLLEREGDRAGAAELWQRLFPAGTGP